MKRPQKHRSIKPPAFDTEGYQTNLPLPKLRDMKGNPWQPVYKNGVARPFQKPKGRPSAKKVRSSVSLRKRNRISRLAYIRRLARDLFTNDAAITQWLKTPRSSLQGMAPIDLIGSKQGTRAVEGLIRGLSYGNFQ